MSSSTLLKRLRSGLRKNATYTAFREVGRVIRTMRLLLISRGGRSGHRGDRLPSAPFWVAAPVLDHKDGLHGV
ncbi:Tn3 family transposase [Streptomyces sp. NPDC059153]|uniref:Tn3 family transposase n=1 Tax=Streptomyces sp. NPDC059153 TaxID=3346743 RepID=UPI0036C0EF37